MTPEQLADAIIGMFVDYEPERHQARRAGTIWMIQDVIAAAEAAAYARAAQCVDDMVVAIERERFGAPHDPRDVVALRAASAAIRALT